MKPQKGGMNPDKDGMNPQEEDFHSPMTASHARQGLDTSCVVTDTGMDSLTPLELYTQAMRKYGVLEDCARIYENPNSTSSESEQAQRDEAIALAEAVHALEKLNSKRVRERLKAWIRQSEAGNLHMSIGHRPELLNSFAEDYWCKTQTCLFYRADCRKKEQLRGRRWAEVLLSRDDFRGWALSKEFAAMVYNIDMGR